MTDARLPERLLNDRRLMRLPPEHFRAYVLSLLWSVSNRTEGLIERDDLLLVPGLIADAPDALERSGLWCSCTAGWEIADFGATQSSRAELESVERARTKARERKARQRERDRERDGHADVPRDSTGKDRTGEARTGRRRRTSITPRPASAFPAESQAISDW